MLFVANADANNVAVFNVADRDDAKPLGFIPVGWYPTSVRFNAGRQAPLRRQRQGHLAEVQPQRAAAVSQRPRAGRVHRRPVPRHAEHDPAAEPGADGPLQPAGLRVQPAAGRRRRDWRRSGRQPDPGEARRSLADQVRHLHHQGEPHLRSGLRRHEGRQRRSDPVPLPRDRSRRTTTSWPASSCCSTTSTSTAKCPPTATNGRWAPTPPISSRRSGR